MTLFFISTTLVPKEIYTPSFLIFSLTIFVLCLYTINIAQGVTNLYTARPTI